MLEALGLSATGAVVYRAMLDHPGHGVDEIAAQCALSPTQVHDHLDELAGLMLVRASADHPGRMRAIDPEVGLADMLARQEAELAARQARLAASRAAVTRMVADRAEHRATHGEHLLGMDAIHARLEQMGHSTTSEVLSSQPGNQRPEDLTASRPADAKVLARGVTMRTLYQDSTRHQPHVTTYAHWLLSQGSEVRTAPAIPQRMVIVDRAQALVPIDPADNRKGALHVTEPGILHALLDLFEQAWNTAVPLGAAQPDDPATGLTPTERELLRLLGTGLTDDAAGQRLGISSRTVGRHMASIMERLGAASRFEAGIKAAHKGWL
ncbi:DNA-binding CsgD family transcriptional regulator/sugar-specific transcriptional regulator TrmB [Kitasatospora gansuensis]|uniref:DNA-binding CsgD family transcriptional regulator/sugar-specific transcriptional regulator TrmB n=1 Tax=Kitasatospora gansuensis TaxID=258050 RepID=A0A7W7SCZ0_9ACTN|nr:LuxR C-terminal-related transcriptional regulator [Kitasatospora gansuensis]MBB4948184.1 DNA-binding CsgD family transcriptional regulator/sugar-specific transcriptional regulator TrmB [Kitasatospora gansuensis]